MKVNLSTFLIILVCVVCDSYGGSTAIFEIKTRQEHSTRYIDCDLKSRETTVTVREGSSVRIDLESQYHIQKSKCLMQRKRLERIPETPRDDELNRKGWFLEVPGITKDKAGLWTCQLMFAEGQDLHPTDREGYAFVMCSVTIKVEEKNIPDAMKIEFKIDTNGDPRCEKPHDLNHLQENQKIQVVVSSRQSFVSGEQSCYLRASETDASQTAPYLNLRVGPQQNKAQSDEKIFGSENNEKYLVCKFHVDSQNQGNNHPVDVKCSIQLFTNIGGKSSGLEQSTVIAICCAVGVIVALIIVGQTIALIYFKSRARYSAPPSRRNTKTNRANAETDSHIYEMVGINALYKESIELDVKNRPQLPLPGQSPLPPPIDSLPRPPKSKPLSSTLSLNSISNCTTLPAKPAKKELPAPPTTMNKGPCRPPKPVDEASLVGTLPRPPKPVPLPKGSSMPKMPSTDPALLELKKALERRVGNAPSSSPSASQQSTLEMKPKIAPPPKLKPPTTQKPAKPQGAQKSPAVGQLAPNLKLLLPKIEASLKPPPPAKPSKAEVSLRPSETPVAVNGPPSIQQKPGVPPFRRPGAEASASSAPVPLRLPPPPTQTSRPLPPIQPEEDESCYSDEDEWTYEQLEKYNIYNI